jgi:hypothetical protein
MKMSPQVANMMGDQLYPLIRDGYDAVSIAACKEAGMYSPLVTPGRMTGMILEAHTEAEMRAILADSGRIAALMVECVEVLCAHEKKQAAAAAAKTPEKKAWGALVGRR